MSIESQTKQIGDFSYKVRTLGAKVGNRVLLKMSKSVGALLLVAGGGRGVTAGAIASALASLSEDDFDWIVMKLSEATDLTLPDGREPCLGGQNGAVFDQHFAGRYDAELEWLEFAIEVNFGPFFLELKRKAAERKRKAEEEAVAKSAASSQAPSPSTSPSTSTGVSNAS